MDRSESRKDFRRITVWIETLREFRYLLRFKINKALDVLFEQFGELLGIIVFLQFGDLFLF